jgi:GH25 family lysozyme M1 (1,4-beta-N-acetylmuramidase)
MQPTPILIVMAALLVSPWARAEPACPAPDIQAASRDQLQSGYCAATQRAHHLDARRARARDEQAAAANLPGNRERERAAKSAAVAYRHAAEQCQAAAATLSNVLASRYQSAPGACD